jgi:hypothetical protein
LGSTYRNAQPRVFKSQGRLKHPSGTFLLTYGKQKPEFFNIPSLGILVCLEGERAYPTLVGCKSECVNVKEKKIRIIRPYTCMINSVPG